MKLTAIFSLLSLNYVGVRDYLRAGKGAFNSMRNRNLDFTLNDDSIEKDSDLEFDPKPLLPSLPNQDPSIWGFLFSLSPEELATYFQNLVSESFP